MSKEPKPIEANPDAPKSCFIVTPIGEPNSEINQKAFGLIKAVMQPVLEKFNYKPIAASDISVPGSINKQIIIRLYEDDLVIANLTGLNPNVMYELAVRHAVKKPVVIMAEKGTKLPFDLVDQRCIFYSDTLHGVDAAKDSLEAFLASALTEEQITNPIYDSLQEQKILKDISEVDKPLSYILERLDQLENNLLRTKRQSQFEADAISMNLEYNILIAKSDHDIVKQIEQFIGVHGKAATTIEAVGKNDIRINVKTRSMSFKNGLESILRDLMQKGDINRWSVMS